MRRTAAVAVGVLMSLTGCGEGDESTVSSASKPEKPTSEPRVPGPAELEAPRCPPALTNCERASGTILYIERVDPDGDGDAHFVLISTEGITAPGISVVDVRPDLRPRPFPRRGDSLAAAGPVYEGSFGQRQIEAIEVAVERR